MAKTDTPADVVVTDPATNTPADVAGVAPAAISPIAWQSGFNEAGERYEFYPGDVVTDPELIASFIERGVPFTVVEA